MDAERWAEIEPLYHAALAKDPAERSLYLEAACAGDPTLREEVETLLAFADAQLASPAPRSQLARLWDASTAPETGAGGATLPANSTPAAIGRYQIIRLLGEGGMGIVYEAEQEHPRRVVALKVIKIGLTTPELLRRFEQESQVLGRLQHPGIAQIYEAATVDGGSQPYFAMELIRGQSLCEYAKALELNVRQRLELMIKICDAVQHAHQRGVIHRDLKPSNILVDAAGQPKVLDFGVARSTDSDTHATRQTDLGELVGTLAYMSPEQMLGDSLELDTRSDVYALGVILYELLAGRLPYQVGQKVYEAVQTIREHDPARLSSISRGYRGDVETIVAKALEKDKARRYASAADLAADIRRYLQDEPIVARPASAAYQISKFARRHKALVAGAAAVFVVLVGGVVASTWQAARAADARQVALQERDRAAVAERMATRERDLAVSAGKTATAAEGRAVEERNRALAEKRRADTEAATTKAVNEFLQKDLLAQASPASQGHPDEPPDPELKVRTVLDRAAVQLAGRFTTKPLVEASISQTIGEAYMDLGLWEKAQEQVERAVALRLRELGDKNPQTLVSMQWLAGVYRNHGNYVRAEALWAKVLRAERELFGERHPETLSSMNGLARAYIGQGKYEQARLLLERTAGGQRVVLGDDHPDTLNTRNELAVVLRMQGKYVEAEPLFTEILKAKRRVLGGEHPFTLTTMNDLSIVYALEGKYSEAEPLLTEVLRIRLRMLGEAHPDALTNMSNLGELYRMEGKYSQAEPLLVKGLDGRRRVLGEDHPQTLATVNYLARLYEGERKYQQAEALYRTALEGRLRVSGPQHPDTLTAMHNLGELLREEGKYAEAEPLFIKVLDGRRRLFGEHHIDTLKSETYLADLYKNMGNETQAEALYTKALEALRGLPGGQDHPQTLNTMNSLALLYLGQGKYAEADQLFSSVLEGRRRTLGAEHPATISTLALLGQTRVQQGKYTDAESILREALKLQEKANPEGWERDNSRSILGATLAAQRRFSEAEPLLLSGYQGLVERQAAIPFESHSLIDQAADRIVQLYQEWGKPEQTAKWRNKLRRP